MRHALGSLAAAALAAGILAWLAGPVLANSTLVHDPNVRVFTPTPLAHGIEGGESTAPQPVVQKVVVHVLVDALALNRAYRAALAWEYRRDRIDRALGHRYTGFIKMYRGPRYPL